MRVFWIKFNFLLLLSFLVQASALYAEEIKVHHVEGSALGFLVIRTPQGEAVSYSELKQVVEPDGLVMDEKSESPSFIESEGPLSEDSPVWRIEVAAPEPDVPKAEKGQ